MKITLDGDMPTIEFRPLFRVDLGEMMNALCSAYRNYGYPPPTRMHPPDLLGAIREEFFWRGLSNIHTWQKGLSPGVVAARLEWARTMILQVIPDLEPPPEDPT